MLTITVGKALQPSLANSFQGNIKKAMKFTTSTFTKAYSIGKVLDKRNFFYHYQVVSKQLYFPFDGLPGSLPCLWME